MTRVCSCGAKSAAVDLLAPSGAALSAELTEAPRSEGAPTRDELFWGGLKSRPQWVLSGVAALVVALWVGSNETAWGWQKVGYAIAEVLLLTLLFRLPMLALALLFRLLVTVLELLLAAGCFIAGKLAKSHRLEQAASNWLVRAQQTLSGDYFWRRTMVEPRVPTATPEAQFKGALLPSAELWVLVATGSHGALALHDAEAPAFQVVLASGETIWVSIDVGTLVLPDGTTLQPSELAAQSPLFRETRCASVPGATKITLQGGEWSESEQGVGYRAPLEPRTLRGTPDRPLVVSLG